MMLNSNPARNAAPNATGIDQPVELVVESEKLLVLTFFGLAVSADDLYPANSSLAFALTASARRQSSTATAGLAGRPDRCRSDELALGSGTMPAQRILPGVICPLLAAVELVRPSPFHAPPLR